MLSLTTLVAGLNVGGPPSDALCRRSVLANAATALLAAPLVSPLAAVADVYGPNSGMPSGEKKVNSFLQQQGFPAMKVPGGCSPLVGYIGTAPPANIDGSKSKERAFDKSLLVRFVYPNGWLPEVPSITENGESGTLGANNYVKGDSATFTAVPLKGNTLQSLSSNKEFFKNFLSAQVRAKDGILGRADEAWREEGGWGVRCCRDDDRAGAVGATRERALLARPRR